MSPRKSGNVQSGKLNKNKSDYKEKLTVTDVQLRKMPVKRLLSIKICARSR